MDGSAGLKSTDEGSEATLFGCQPAAKVASVRPLGRTAGPEPKPGQAVPVMFDSAEAEAEGEPFWSEAMARYRAFPAASNAAIHSVRGARCLTPSMVVVAPGDIIIGETWATRKSIERIPGFGGAKRKSLVALRGGRPMRAAIAPAVPIDGNFFLLSSAPYPNWFHWLIEAVPNIGLWRALGGGRRLLVPRLGHRMQRMVLDHLGVEIDHRLEIGRHVSIAGELVFADRISPISSHISPHIVQFFKALRSRALEDRAVTAATPKRIFISRADAEVRRVTNEAEIMERLGPLGFERVVCEHLSFGEQIALFASAEAVVAPHGAGLANIAFCREGAVVVELSHQLFQASAVYSFPALSNLFGHRHGVVIGMAEKPGVPMRAESMDFRVGPDAIVAMLEELGAA